MSDMSVLAIQTLCNKLQPTLLHYIFALLLTYKTVKKLKIWFKAIDLQNNIGNSILVALNCSCLQ